MPIKYDENINAIRKEGIERAARRIAAPPIQEPLKPIFRKYIDPLDSEAVKLKLRPSTPPSTPMPPFALDNFSRSNSFDASSEAPVLQTQEIDARRKETFTSTMHQQQQILAQGSKVRVLRQLRMNPNSSELEEDSEIATITGHFAGSAISLRKADRRPLVLNLASINSEATSLRGTPEPEAPRAPRKGTSVFFPSHQEQNSTPPLSDTEAELRSFRPRN